MTPMLQYILLFQGVDEMERLYSQMSKEELKALMKQLKEDALQLYEQGAFQEVMVLRTKYYLAASYLMDPSEIKEGATYYVEGIPGNPTFVVTRLDGIMAHGILSSSPVEEAYPIAMLSKEPTDTEQHD